MGEQGHAMDVRGRGDRKIERAAPWLAAALGDRRVQPAAVAGYGGVEGQCIEVPSIVARRCMRRARVSSSGATKTPKCSSVSKAKLRTY